MIRTLIWGQYRVTFTLYGAFVETWIPETAKRAGHWRLTGGKQRDRAIAEAKRAREVRA